MQMATGHTPIRGLTSQQTERPTSAGPLVPSEELEAWPRVTPAREALGATGHFSVHHSDVWGRHSPPRDHQRALPRRHCASTRTHGTLTSTVWGSHSLHHTECDEELWPEAVSG